ncbi:hypothetical protein VYU27_000242 [Nannochloropsis oceanica]
MFYFAIQVATTHAQAASTLEGGRPHSSNLTTTAIRPFPITGGWRAWRRINSMSSASLAAAVDVAIPSTNYYASSTSPTSPPRMKTNDQQALSTTPSRRQRQQQSTGLTRPIKMSGRQSLQQKGAKTEGKYTMGKESDALFGEAEVNTSRCVGILFLAHDGVANPSLWEKWRESDPAFASRIRFFVFRNEAISHTSTFANQNDLLLRMRTKWCCSSIVRATVKSLDAILTKDADVEIIYIVSGFDIPIQPPSAFFTTRAVVTEGVPKSVVPFQTVLAFTPGEDAPFKVAKGWGKKNEDVRQSVVCHVQWCGLARDHAQRIVEFPELDRFLDIGNKMSKACCPDEWVLGTILSLQLRGEEGRKMESQQGKKDENKDQEKKNSEEEGEGKEEPYPEEGDRKPAVTAATATVTAIVPPPATLTATVPPGVTDWPVTDQYRAKRQAQSPLVWSDLDTTTQKVLWAPPQTYRSFTLEKVVEQVSRNEGNLFFRKVSPLTEKEIDRLIPYQEAKEVPDAAATNAGATPAVVVDKRGMASTVGQGSSCTSATSDLEGVDDEARSSMNSSRVPTTPQTHLRLPEQEEEEEEGKKVVTFRAGALPTYGHRVMDRRRRRGCPDGGGRGVCCEECG